MAGGVQAEPSGSAEAHARTGVEALARVGYAARGVVYGAVGLLALLAALGEGGDTTGGKGALARLVTAPGGRVLLGVVGLGLAGFAVWRIVQAALDPEDKGTDAKGLLVRATWLASAFVNGALAVWAFSVAFGGGSSGGGGGSGAEGLTAKVMQAPAGRWLVAAAGIVVIVFAGFQERQAWTARFARHLSAAGRWVRRAGRLGYAARGVVYALVGVFLLRAALDYDPQEAGGLGEALRSLGRQPYGPWLLGVVAVGLVAYGVFSALEARYRRVSP